MSVFCIPFIKQKQKQKRKKGKEKKEKKENLTGDKF